MKNRHNALSCLPLNLEPQPCSVACGVQAHR